MLDFCAHYLRSARRYRTHLLTEPEEKLLTEKSVSGAGAWVRLFDELTSAITIDLPNELVGADGDGSSTVGLEQGLSMLQHPDREVRRTAAEAVTAGLAPGLRTRAFVFNTLLLDKSVDDRAALLPELDLVAEPRQRGIRRVGPGTGRRRRRPLRHPPAVVHAQGPDPRRRSARRLRPDGVGRRRRELDRMVGGEGDRARLLRQLLPGPGSTSPGGSSTSAGSTHRSGPANAPAPSVPTRSRPTTPTCC